MKYNPIARKVFAIVPLIVLVMIFYVKNSESNNTDESITTRVKQAFAEDTRLKRREIKVETRDGVVRLSGVVDSKIDVVRAANIAKNVDGVKKVDTDIKIAHSPAEKSFKLPNSCSVTGLGWC